MNFLPVTNILGFVLLCLGFLLTGLSLSRSKAKIKFWLYLTLALTVFCMATYRFFVAPPLHDPGNSGSLMPADPTFHALAFAFFSLALHQSVTSFIALPPKSGRANFLSRFFSMPALSILFACFYQGFVEAINDGRNTTTLAWLIAAAALATLCGISLKRYTFILMPFIFSVTATGLAAATFIVATIK